MRKAPKPSSGKKAFSILEISLGSSPISLAISFHRDTPSQIRSNSFLASVSLA